LIGPGRAIDTNLYYVVCANVIGSCYGSTGPLSTDPKTGTPFLHFFPDVTVRDMSGAHELLRNHLEIDEIYLLIGGSLGAQQALEWAIQSPDTFKNLCVLATNAQHSPWGIAFNATQRMAIENDPTWELPLPEAGADGLETARAIAMLSYRHYNTYERTQKDSGENLHKHFKAESYQRYQGKKLRDRFNAISYWYLSKAMDGHDVGRGRGGVKKALSQIKAQTICIGISSDILFPPSEQQLLKDQIKNAKYFEVESDYGHDGFLG
jgi:homoserine O-acetyltransferase